MERLSWLTENLQFRITMAAIDPTQVPEIDEHGTVPTQPRATLKIVRQPIDEDDSDDEDYMQALIGGGSDSEGDSEDDSEEEEANGGPSDPAKSKKARKEAALKQLMESLNDDDESSDEEMADAANGVAKADKKGKAKANSDEESDEDSDDGEDIEIEEFVLCTLDPEKVGFPCQFRRPSLITVELPTTTRYHHC